MEYSVFLAKKTNKANITILNFLSLKHIIKDIYNTILAYYT